jgi:hypothetical protein
MPTALTILLGLAGAGVAAATLALKVGATRDRWLDELGDQHAALKERLTDSTIQAEVNATVAFLKAIEKRRGKIVLRTAAIDERFGDWFFDTAHGLHGVDPFLEHKDFATVKSLYRAWASHWRKDTQKDIALNASLAARRWARHTNRQRSKTRILWHHKIQELDSTLFFWRLRFEPSYNQDKILQSLHVICEDFNVTSYVAYELLGPHDILMRAWLSDPEKASAVEVTESEEELIGPQPTRITHMTQRLSWHTTDDSNDYFRVETIYRHWWWVSRRLSLKATEREPNEEFEFELKKPSAATRAQTLVNGYNAGTISRRRLWRSYVWWQYRSKGLVRRRRLHGGIKFATIVRAKPKHEPPVHESKHPIVVAIKNARYIRDRSLYACVGFHQNELGPAQFLILGRVRGFHFGRLRKHVIDPILEPQISKDYAPPLTYIATGPDTMRQTFQDGIKGQ